MIKTLLSGGAGYAIIGALALGFWQGAKWQKNTQAAKDLKIERLEHQQALTNKDGEIEALQLKIQGMETVEAEAEKTRSEQNQKFTQQRANFRRDLAAMQKQLERENGGFYETALPYNTIARFNCAAHGVMCQPELAGADTAEGDSQDGQGEGGYRRDATDPSGDN